MTTVNVLEAARVALAEMRDRVHSDDLVLQVHDETLPTYAKVVITGFPPDDRVLDAEATVIVTENDMDLTPSNSELAKVIFNRLVFDRRVKGSRI